MRSERVSLRVFEGGREEVDIEESAWRNTWSEICKAESKKRKEKREG